MKLKSANSFVKMPSLALANRDENAMYLCKRGLHLFVSDIRVLVNPDHTMPANCTRAENKFEPICLYVDDVVAKYCVPINHLDEMYEIVA